MTPGDYHNKHEKEAIVRVASEVSKCATAILCFRTSTPGEPVAFFASFASYEPPFISKGLPTVGALAKFKKRLFIDKDPDWCAF